MIKTKTHTTSNNKKSTFGMLVERLLNVYTTVFLVSLLIVSTSAAAQKKSALEQTKTRQIQNVVRQLTTLRNDTRRSNSLVEQLKALSKKGLTAYQSLITHRALADHFTTIGRYHQAIEELEIAGQAANVITDSFAIAAIEHHKARLHLMLSQYGQTDKALSLALMAVEAAKNDSLRIKIMQTKADLATSVGDTRSARRIDAELYNRYGKGQKSGLAAELLYNLGIDSHAMAEYNEAQQYFQQAIRIAKTSKRWDIEAEGYRQMAQMFIEIKDIEKGEYYLTQFDTSADKKNPENQVYSLILHGELAVLKKQFEQANQYFREAINRANDLEDTFLLDYASIDLINLLVQQQRFDQAIKIGQTVLPRASSMHYTVLVYLYPSLGEAYFKLAPPNFPLAEKYLKLGLEQATRANITDDIQFSYDLLSKLYEAKKDFKQGLDYARLAHRYKDSILSVENTKKLAELHVQFETARKEQRITNLQQQNKLAKLESSKQRQQSYGLAIGLALLALSSAAIVFAYLKSRKLNTYLKEEERRKETLLQEVHHRTNNSLQMISALLTMQEELIEDETAKLALRQSESRIHSMSALHEMLHNNSDSVDVDMAEYLDHIIDFHQGLAWDEVNITCNLMSAFLPAKKALPVALLTNELITNALKYAFDQTSDPHIHIVFHKYDEENRYLLQVSDNGKGLPPEMFSKGYGNMGSKLIQLLTRQIKGVLSTENQSGAVISIQF